MKHIHFETTTPNGLTFTLHGNPGMKPETLAALHEMAELAYIQLAYPEKRADGWPLCPCCGEDELWSPSFRWNGECERPPMKAWILAGLRCSTCNWSSDDA